jgi:cysteine sulfinate desulfinase
MEPWQGGGEMLTQASFDGFTPKKPPHCFEAGTPNIAGVLGIGAVLHWLNTQNLTAAEQYSCTLAEQAEQQLQHLPGWRSFRCPGSSVLAFEVTGIHHSDIATLLTEQNIAVRAGQHCAHPLMAALGVNGTVRASFAPYNTPDDVNALAQAVQHAVELLAE